MTAREYGQTVGLLERLGIPHTVVGAPRRRLDGGKGARARARAARRSRAGPAGAALRPRARPRLGRPRGRLDACCASPRRRCRTTSTPASSASSPSAPPSGCWRPDAIPVEAMERAGAARAKLFRYPGLKEDYYLADFEPDPAVLERARARPRAGAGRGAPAAGDLRLPRATTRCTSGVLDRLAADPDAAAVVIPRTERQGEAVRAPGRPVADRPARRHRRPEPDRLRRPGRQRRRAR